MKSLFDQYRICQHFHRAVACELETEADAGALPLKISIQNVPGERMPPKLNKINGHGARTDANEHKPKLLPGGALLIPIEREADNDARNIVAPKRRGHLKAKQETIMPISGIAPCHEVTKPRRKQQRS